MDHFVQGVLDVEDEVYVSDPDIRLSNGKKIHILYTVPRAEIEWQEPEDYLLSALLEVNQWYELLLIIQLGRRQTNTVIYASSIPTKNQLELVPKEFRGFEDTVLQTNKVMQGVILDLNWDATSQHYLASAKHRLYTSRFVLVETAIGKMVVSYKVLQEQLGEQIEQLAVGGYLEWERSRLELLAIIEKRDPRPGE